MERFSRKREWILALLRSTTEHPSAEWVYRKMKPVFPAVSIATVYRNLKHLQEQGLIRSVGIVQGEERFDATTTPHAHAVCVLCGRMVDVDGVTLPDDLTRRAEIATDFALSETNLRFSGVCAACRAARKNDHDTK